jgi:hypothetical protein
MTVRVRKRLLAFVGTGILTEAISAAIARLNAHIRVLENQTGRRVARSRDWAYPFSNTSRLDMLG